MVVFIGTETNKDNACIFLGYTYDPIFIAIARYPDSFSIFVGLEFTITQINNTSLTYFVGFELMHHPWCQSNLFIGLSYGHDNIFVFAGWFKDHIESSYFFGLSGSVI
jgi:hypothetical protein